MEPEIMTTWKSKLMLLPNFTCQPFDILKGKVKAGHDHQNDGGGKDDTEAQGYGHGNQIKGLTGSFQNNGRKPTKGGQGGQDDGPETP